MSFKNKVVLITGASAGIGAKTAIKFAEEGANVAIVGRNEARLAEVEEEITRIGSKPLVIKADISKEDEANTVVEKTIAAFGKLDVLVNNAGVFRYSTLFDDNFIQMYDDIMNINMRPVVIISTHAATYLKETKGNIINISSIAGELVSIPGFTAYRTSKAAMNHFTRAIALELAPYGVRANIVSPGPVKTGIFETGGAPINAEGWKKFTALNRASEPEEVADMILFLASEKARGITGSNHFVDNGNMIK